MRQRTVPPSRSRRSVISRAVRRNKAPLPPEDIRLASSGAPYRHFEDTVGLGLLRAFWECSRSLVGVDLDAVGSDRPSLDDAQLAPVDAIGEEALAPAEDGGEHHQPELVDEVVLEQRAHERAAAGHEDHALCLAYELSDLLRDL